MLSDDYDALESLRKHATELRTDLARIEDRIKRLENAQWQQFQTERDAALNGVETPSSNELAEWHAEADRLRKCVEYAPTESDKYTFRLQLGTHLHKKPRTASGVPEPRPVTPQEGTVLRKAAARHPGTEG